MGTNRLIKVHRIPALNKVLKAKMMNILHMLDDSSWIGVPCLADIAAKMFAWTILFSAMKK